MSFAPLPGRPIALFAPRRVGKTYFLDGDLAPAAEKAGLLPVYADLWLKRAAPLDAINHALEEALDDVKVPKSSTSKLVKTAVRKIGASCASIEQGDGPARGALSDKPELRMDALITRLASEFEHIGYKQALMPDIAKEMSVKGITNVDQALLVVLAHRLAPMGKDSLQALDRITGKAVTLANVRVALHRMRKSGILSKRPSVGHTIADRLFKDFVVKAFVAKYLGDGRLKALPG